MTVYWGILLFVEWYWEWNDSVLGYIIICGMILRVKWQCTGIYYHLWNDTESEMTVYWSILSFVEWYWEWNDSVLGYIIICGIILRVKWQCTGIYYHLWNDTESEMTVYWGILSFQCHFVRHKSHTEWAGAKPARSWWKAHEQKHEPSHRTVVSNLSCARLTFFTHRTTHKTVRF